MTTTRTTKSSALWPEETLSNTTIHTLVNQLQQQPGGPIGYRLRRIILTNFWLYDYQEIEIPHGRLFLAGENASGKSTVMAAAIPLALDGDYRPERLDTFGKREKRIDYYILGSTESATPFQRDQCTSSIALEFEWCDPEHPPFASELRTYWEKGDYERARFLTIGIVFSGNRNNVHPITAFRFLITDGSRLGYNGFSTYQEFSTGRKAYDFKTFKKTIAEHGLVCETSRDYTSKVSQYLFNFSNVTDFQRLLQQLLYLRQPNLNTVLSLESVRKFLDKSLPQIPDDLLQHAANTLELMDTLQNEITRRKQAYGAVERLHTAQQSLAIARTRLAACEYIHHTHQEQAATNEVQRLKRLLTRAENELRRATQSIEELEREQDQVNGKIAAIEGSEGLQAVQRLNQATARMHVLERTLADQKRILEDAIARREQDAEDIEQHQREFGQTREKALEWIISMEKQAREKALWESAAEQLTDLHTHVQQLNLERAAATVSQISTTLPALLPTNVETRITWLNTLRQLHQQINRETVQLQNAQGQETRLFQEVDEVTRSFEQEREQAYAALQELADQLDALLEEIQHLPQSYFTDLHEQMIIVYNATLSPRDATQQLNSTVQGYTARIEQALDGMNTTLRQLQKDANALRSQQGGKAQEVRQAQEAYQRKQQEPENTPSRSEHRAQARQQLTAAAISAFPLYKLIDFTPDIDGQSPLAGGLEYMLEDAGLLDALVIRPDQAPRADTLLTQNGLTDCRLRLPISVGTGLALSASTSEKNSSSHWLRIDPAVQNELGDNYPLWEEHLTSLITTIEQTLAPNLQQSDWQHGLLSGQRGQGSACYIGKDNREREQQQALSTLYQRWQQLQSELTRINDNLAALEQQHHTITTQRDRLSPLARDRRIETHTIALHTRLDTLERTQERYQKARNETQTIRQHIQDLRLRLHREARGVDRFINNPASIDEARESITALVSDANTLQLSLQNVLRSLHSYHKSTEQHDKARVSELLAAQTYQSTERDAERVRTEIATLQQLLREVTGDNVEDLFSQLQALQERQQTLPAELQEAYAAKTKSETLLAANQDTFIAAQETQTHARSTREQSYQAFLSQLIAYPVEQLQILHRSLTNEFALPSIQALLDEPLSTQEEQHLLLKSQLEKQHNTTYNALFQVYSEVINLLHEYGTTIDPQGIIRFLNAENATPYELLNQLADEISKQERLLDERERTLFQNFLLQEMADVIRKHIIDAEDWVRKMNKFLGHTAFVGEHYHLNWTPKERDQISSGGHLAQYYQLLRRQAQTLKEEEIETLVYAFRQEIANLRAQQQSANNTVPFAEGLSQIFDYRDWFRFEIFVTRTDGTRQHLTDRYFKQRSGAEQYTALYIPFFAALSALYESAGKGAPRLIALDEAFERVSPINTQRLLTFLSDQQFQWIMTGPLVTGEGTGIPACARYVMLHNKGTEVATSFPSFWNSHQNQSTPEGSVTTK